MTSHDMPDLEQLASRVVTLHKDPNGRRDAHAPIERWSPTSSGCAGPAQNGRMGENVCWQVEVRR